MATVKFLTRSKKNPTKIYIRFINGRAENLMRSTPLVVNPEYFNNKTGKVRQISHYKERTNLEASLASLKSLVLKKHMEAVENNIFINSEWLQNCINQHFNLVKVTDNNFIANYCDYFIERLPLKVNDKTGELGVTKATEKKYATIKRKIVNFDNYKRKRHRLTDVNLSYRNEFLKYLLEVDKLGRNTAGRYIKFLKSICLDAQKNGFHVSNELIQIKGFSLKVDKIYLDFKDLEKIENTTFEDERFNNAKDWLLIGCYIGQRAGDLLQLTKENIKFNGNLEFIELIQQKTQKRVSILIHPKVKSILEKRNENFPPAYTANPSSSVTMFNRAIKEVCKKAELNYVVSGSKINKETKRKEKGEFPKYELITSHICRRSFATNYYGDIPTPLLLNITGHSNEKEFLNYIGKTAIDYAQQMATYWNIESQKQQIKEGKQETPMRVAN
ncbi:tyrosine-type recombinase/integrase [Tenacibaculum sp. M341]|uniref:tyrosine-type recombinase/integrase n=1 Tax=Tenacibaculum sp. M341 TaxID=2530339 RepID=UPI001404FC42|nr:tyrosine-type recombinase/integrase [Tenacibaculum sp. M341]